MRRYLLRRLLLAIPTFFGITLLSFALLQLAPGDGGEVGDLTGVTQAAREALRHQRGLDRPLLVRYLDWLEHVATLDFGRSSQDARPVTEKIREALPRTLFLASTALFLAYLIAVPLGAISAAKKGRAIDRAISVAMFALYSLPSFWVAIMLLLTLCAGHPFAIFPLQGLVSENFAALSLPGKIADAFWHALLPVTCLAYAAVALLSRYVRAGMLDVLRRDFIRTARAKGVSERLVVFRHALRNSLLPVITLLGLMIPHLIGGSVVVERIFGIPGMGLLVFDAILARDEAMVMGVTTMVALLTLFSMLASDLLYGLADPRIELEVP